MNQSEVVQWLQDLNDHEFTTLFYEAVAGRSAVDELERNYLQSHYVLARATRMREDDDRWSTPEIELIALHDEAEYPEGWQDNIPPYQGAYCCEHEVVTWAKHFVCPACGSRGMAT